MRFLMGELVILGHLLGEQNPFIPSDFQGCPQFLHFLLNHLVLLIARMF